MKVACAVALILAACGTDDAAAPAQVSTSARQLPAVTSYDAQPWSAVATPGDPAVATVEGVVITRSMLTRELARAEDGADVRAVLNRLIDLELIARAAHERGHLTAEVVGRAHAKALVRRYVESNFLARVTRDQIPDDVMERAYDFARARYDRFPVFKIKDAQVICCPNENPDGCYRELFDNVVDRRAHFEACMRDHAAAWDGLAKRVTGASDAANFEFLARGAFTEFPSPELRETYRPTADIATYEFQYDLNSTYEDQFKKVRYQMFYQEIMDGVRNAYLAAGSKTPFFTPVIKSPIGYHLLYVSEVLPEVHRPLSDPGVQAELRERLFEQFKTGEFRSRTEALCKQRGCDISVEELAPLEGVR